MHLVFLNQKGNQTKLEALEMEIQYAPTQYYAHYTLGYAHTNTYFYKEKSFI